MINEEKVIFFKVGKAEELIRQYDVVEIITPLGQDNITGRITCFRNEEIYIDCSKLYNADIVVLKFHEVRSIRVLK